MSCTVQAKSTPLNFLHGQNGHDALDFGHRLAFFPYEKTTKSPNVWGFDHCALAEAVSVELSYEEWSRKVAYPLGYPPLH